MMKGCFRIAISAGLFLLVQMFLGCASYSPTPKERSFRMAMSILQKPLCNDTFDRVNEMSDVDALRVIAFASRSAAWSMEAGPDVEFDLVMLEMSLAAIHRLFMLDSASAREAIDGYKNSFLMDGAFTLLFDEWESEVKKRRTESKYKSDGL